jgi:hypothetical protein
MRVREADALCVQSVRFCHAAQLPQRSYAAACQFLQFPDGIVAIAQRTKRELSDDTGVDCDLSLLDERSHIRVSSPEIINPDGCIRQSHKRSALVRGISSRSGMEPSGAASLRDASIWIRAFSASRRRADRSVIPDTPELFGLSHRRRTQWLSSRPPHQQLPPVGDESGLKSTSSSSCGRGFGTGWLRLCGGR